MPSVGEQIAVTMLPVGLAVGGNLLVNRDANKTGADDAVGQIMLALSSRDLVNDLFHRSPDASATLRAMRLIEQTAHDYRVSVNDTTLNG